MLRHEDLEGLRGSVEFIGVKWAFVEAVHTREGLEELKQAVREAHARVMEKLGEPKRWPCTTSIADRARDMVEALEPSDFANMQTHDPHIEPNMEYGTKPDDAAKKLEGYLGEMAGKEEG